jgi:8-oxo-dGTP pyrophosphatase MutT (NUDIX family)
VNATDARLRWEEISRRRIASSAIFDLYETVRVSPDGRRGEFWLLDAPDWVNVVPLLRSADGEAVFVMVRQFRHGAGMITTEFPAGLVERGEGPRAAAARELLEETGYRAGTLTPLGKVQPNPAFMGNWCHSFLAEDLVPADGGRQDALELMDAIVVPVREVQTRMGKGEYVNSLALVSLHLYHRAIAERA